ncbi:MAG: hypothetical protein CVU95_10940 [Firmicutes bacterium HGW-Firmicutes-2]|nr:MAG: hypothetical protein CVU95_10940 [Firmicutes bacterium HGW-Firmicutes-2]
MRRNVQNQLFFVTILFFILGIFHISLAVFGLICFILPFYQYFRYKDKLWCKYYCPRAGIFTVIFGKIGLRKKLPNWIKNGKGKEIVLYYFGVNLLFATMSTIMVSLGRIDPIDHVRFLMLFEIPIVLPQILTYSAPSPAIHLGYRVYSMMLTSTIIGSVLAFFYLPRTWCMICPIQTLTTKKI